MAQPSDPRDPRQGNIWDDDDDDMEYEPSVEMSESAAETLEEGEEEDDDDEDEDDDEDDEDDDEGEDFQGSQPAMVYKRSVWGLTTLDAAEELNGIDIQFTIEPGGDDGDETETENRATETRPMRGMLLSFQDTWWSC